VRCSCQEIRACPEIVLSISTTYRRYRKKKLAHSLQRFQQKNWNRYVRQHYLPSIYDRGQQATERYPLAATGPLRRSCHLPWRGACLREIITFQGKSLNQCKRVHLRSRPANPDCECFNLHVILRDPSTVLVTCR
jgi:hypothetical protein